MSDRPLCCHCRRRLGRRPGGLCRACWDQPAIRALYRSAPVCLDRGTRRGWRRDFCGGYQLPDAATPARPGTRDKIAALEERARLGVSLWHPADAPVPIKRGDPT